MRRSRRLRRKNKKQKIFLITIMCFIFVFMTVGYAAMQTQLNISAKGNIINKNLNVSQFINSIPKVTSGDGLYKDTYENNQYIYKGSNPNNYIKFNNELWRIISLNFEDSTIKIIKNDTIGEMMWADECSTVAYNYNGINNKKYSIDNIIYLAGDFGNCSVFWNQGSLQFYLNNDYYQSINYNYQNKVTTYDWQVGSITDRNTDLKSQIEDEKQTNWNGKIGLITVSEYIKANSDVEKCGSFYLYNSNSELCQNTNWLFNNSNIEKWTITNYRYDQVYYIGSSGTISYVNTMGFSLGTTSNVYPALYLSPEIQITGGDGTESNPYTIL